MLVLITESWNQSLENVSFLVINMELNKLWCTKTSKVVISKDVVFDEYPMIQNLPRKDSSVTTQKKKNTQVELEIGSGSKPESSAQFSSEVNESVALSLPPPPRVQQYSIAKDKPRKVIRPPQKY